MITFNAYDSQDKHSTHTLKKSEYNFTSCELTSESVVCSLDSPVQNKVASLLNPLGRRFYSGQDSSDVKDWTSELKPQHHSQSPRANSWKVCRQRVKNNNDTNIEFT